MNLLSLAIEALEGGYVPGTLTRIAIRRLCRQRLSEHEETFPPDRVLQFNKFLEVMQSGPIALVPEQANQQHYELPPEFFAAVLGPRRKYSCCYWGHEQHSLEDAEVAALEITCQRAELANGQTILELGCGWGSLSLWMAERFPDSQITAVSNSAPQRQFIESEIVAKGFTNLQVVTADMNTFTPAADQLFDRVVSVEMFEHMRNYELLCERIASWLQPGGKLFVHIFCHREMAYPFETDGPANWMGRHFFTGGLMPSFDLLRQFSRHLHVESQWAWEGRHYQKTSEAWLKNLDAHATALQPLLESTYRRDARGWLYRWRTFFLAVAELFGYGEGREWFVGHYLLTPVRAQRGRITDVEELSKHANFLHPTFGFPRIL